MMQHMKCYGSTVIGEKGQVVIPAEVRKKFGIKSGDKFLVLSTGRGRGIFLLRADAMAEMIKEMFGNDLRTLLGEESAPRKASKNKKRR